MHEKKSSEKNSQTAALERFPTEILVARGRSFEPFVKTFVQSGENISSLDLGTLVGVFEVNERSEDSAYIVNFLASVAKKEYFGNPRRGAVESFEAALHKVNLALAELVKHGNVAWLGSFHGVIGAFEKGGMHFSATGQGAILLLRNTSLTDISEGLASDEASAHPIKTFTEISSGRLLADDRIIFSSPELLRLFTQEDLLKNALRMDEGRFDQFLKTALVNELDMAGTIVMHIKEGSRTPKKAPEKKPEPVRATVIENVFSQSAFSKKPPEMETAETEARATDDPRNEYVDSKTGHIYVQGNDPVEPAAHPVIERASLFFQELGASFRASAGTQSKWFRRMKKQSAITVAEMAESLQASRDRMISALKRKATERKRLWNEKRAAQAAVEEAAVIAPPAPASTSALQEAARPIATPSVQQLTPVIPPVTAPISVPEEAEIPLFIREKLAAFYQKERSKKESGSTSADIEIRETEIMSSASISQKTVLIASSAYRSIQPIILSASSTAAKQTGRLIQNTGKAARKTAIALSALSPKRRLAIIGSSLALLGAAGAYVFFSSNDAAKQAATPEALPAETSETPAYADEKNARQIGDLAVVSHQNGILSVVALDDRTYTTSSESIQDISEGREYKIPSGGGKILLSAPMDDLRLVFLYTDQGRLFAWSPISRTFAENTLALPQGAEIRSIGTYLTYLYALDSANGQIYRFPRADGGFGAPTSWLRESLSMNERSRMAVSESIIASPDGTSIKSFFRGRMDKDFEAPTAPLFITDIASRPDASAAYVLDNISGRIVSWNKDGAIEAQYFGEQLKDARSIAWNGENNELLIATGSGIFSLKP